MFSFLARQNAIIGRRSYWLGALYLFRLPFSPSRMLLAIAVPDFLLHWNQSEELILSTSFSPSPRKGCVWWTLSWVFAFATLKKKCLGARSIWWCMLTTKMPHWIHSISLIRDCMCFAFGNLENFPANKQSLLLITTVNPWTWRCRNEECKGKYFFLWKTQCFWYLF